MQWEYRDPDERLEAAIEAFQQGRIERARSELSELLELGFHCTDVHLYLGHCALGEDQLATALRHYREARRRGPDVAEICVGLAVVAARRLNFRRATRLLRRAVVLDPRHQEAYDNLILTHAALGELEASEEAFRCSLKIDADSPHPYFNSAFVHFDRGEAAQACELWKRVIQVAPDYPDAERMVATCERLDGRLDEARRRLERWLKLDPRDVGAWSDLGLVHENRDEWQSAVEAYRRALEIDPLHARVRSRLGYLLYSNEFADEGLAHLRRAGKDDPDDPEVAELVAGVLREAGKTPEALWTLRRAVRAAPYEPEPRIARGRYFESAGRPARAAAEYARAHRLDPEDPTPVFGLARCLAAAGATAQAVEVLEGGLARFADQATTYGMLSEFALHRGDVEGAARYLEQGLERLPREPNLTVRLADSYLRLGRIPHAIALARCTRREQGFAVASLDVLGRAYLELGEYDRVVNLAETLLENQPDHPRGVYLRGRARLMRGDAAAATADLRSYVRAAPGDPEGYRSLASCLDALGEDDAARVQKRIGEYLERTTV